MVEQNIFSGMFKIKLKKMINWIISAGAFFRSFDFFNRIADKNKIPLTENIPHMIVRPVTVSSDSDVMQLTCV